MRTVGIIAEYNPFHSGHAYQIREAKRLTGADYAIVVMSPDFVQRGTPALLDKYTRTRMALLGGADAVFELPVCYATGSAEYFAEGAVALLDHLGAVDYLSFGYEKTDDSDAMEDWQLLLRTAEILARPRKEESSIFRSVLQEHLRSGKTYAQARTEALIAEMTVAASSAGHENSSASGNRSSAQEDRVRSLLSRPNNILAIEYLKALKRLSSRIQPVPIPRKGAGYSDGTMPDEGTYASASAIRNWLYRSVRDHSVADGSPAYRAEKAVDMSALSAYLPSDTLQMLQSAISADELIFEEDFSLLLHMRLLEEKDSFCEFQDVTDELGRRIAQMLPQYTSVRQFTELIKTKQIAEARVRRALLHILLGQKLEDTERCRKSGTVYYARLPGFRKDASPLLHKIKENGAIPVLSKLADAQQLLTQFYSEATVDSRRVKGEIPLAEDALAMLEADLHASDLYELVLSHRCGRQLRSEYTRQLQIL